MQQLLHVLSAASTVQPTPNDGEPMTHPPRQPQGTCLQSLHELLRGIDMRIVGACAQIRMACGDHQVASGALLHLPFTDSAPSSDAANAVVFGMASMPAAYAHGTPTLSASNLPFGGHVAAATAIQSLARGAHCRSMMARDIGLYFVRAGAAQAGDPGTISRSDDIVMEHAVAFERTRMLTLIAGILQRIPTVSATAPEVVIGAVLTIQSHARGCFTRRAAAKVMVDLDYFARRANGHHARAADPLQMFAPFLRSELQGMQQGFDMLYPSPPSVTDSEDSGFASMSDSPNLLTTFDADTDWNRLRAYTTIIQSHVRALITRRIYQAALSDMYDQYQCVCDGCLEEDVFDVRLVRRTVVAHIHETLGELQHAHTQDEMTWFHAFDFLDPYN